jgi:single-strand DNA-binding protein
MHRRKLSRAVPGRAGDRGVRRRHGAADGFREVQLFNEAHISLTGYVATQPTYGATRTGVPTINMRVAWTPRRMDRVTGEWVDADTSFCTVFGYRKLAENAATCVRKGDPIVVRGRVTVRDFEDKRGHQRSAMEIDAISLGHDLSRGVASFQRVRPQVGLTASEHQDVKAAAAGDGETAGASGEMFDEAAVEALAEEEASVAVPF